MLRLAWSVHHASHYREFHLLDAWILFLPCRHAGAEIALNLLGHLLEESGSCSSAAWAGCNLRREAADPEGLQNLLCYQDLFAAVAIGSGRK